MYCRHCGAQLPDGSKFCTACGKAQTDENAVVYCSACGAQVAAGVDTCPACGAPIVAATPAPAPAPQSNPVPQPAPASQPTIIINNTNSNVNTVGGQTGKRCNKWVSFFLCLFLGVFGGHRFYEGRIGSGILYLFTAGLFFVGVIVDLIAILGKPDPYYVN